MDKNQLDYYLDLLYEFMGEFKETMVAEYKSIPDAEEKFSYEQFVVVRFSNIVSIKSSLNKQ